MTNQANLTSAPDDGPSAERQSTGMPWTSAQRLARSLNMGGDARELLEAVPVGERQGTRRAILPLLKMDTMKRLADDAYIARSGMMASLLDSTVDQPGHLWSANLWAQDAYKQASGRSWVVKIWWDATNRDFEPIELRQSSHSLMRRTDPERTFRGDSLQQQAVTRNQVWTLLPPQEGEQAGPWVEQQPVRNLRSVVDDTPGQEWARCTLRADQEGILFGLMEERNKTWAMMAYDLIESWWDEKASETSHSEQSRVVALPLRPPSGVTLSKEQKRWQAREDGLLWVARVGGYDGPELEVDSSANSTYPKSRQQNTWSFMVSAAMTQEDYALTRRWGALNSLARSATHQPKGQGILSHMAFLERHRDTLDRDLGEGGCERVKKCTWRHWVHQIVDSWRNIKRAPPPTAVLDALRQTCPSQEDYQWSAQKMGSFMGIAFDGYNSDSGWLVPMRDWITGWTYRRPGLAAAKRLATGVDQSGWLDHSVGNLDGLVKSLMGALVVPEVWTLPLDAPQRVWIEQMGWKQPGLIGAAAPGWLEKSWAGQIHSRAGSIKYALSLSIEEFTKGGSEWAPYLDNLLQAEVMKIVDLRRADVTLANSWNGMQAAYEQEILRQVPGAYKEDGAPKKRTRTV